MRCRREGCHAERYADDVETCAEHLPPQCPVCGAWVAKHGDICSACATCPLDGCERMRIGPDVGQRFCERCTEELVAMTLSEMTPAQMRAAGFVDEEGYPDNAEIIERVYS